MKELNEYRDDIFRRSEQKKRQIKKRRRIALAVGVPLCLCCILTPVMFSGGLARKDYAPSMDMTNDHFMNQESEAAGMTLFCVTDPDKVEKVLELLEDPSASKEETENNAVLDRLMPDDYVMTLERSDGSILTYRMSGCTAYCETTGESKMLTREQTEAIYGLVVDFPQNHTPIEQRFFALVVECGDNWVMVEPLEGETERNSCDRICFSTRNLYDIRVQVGAKVEIAYQGEIMETYPAQISPIFWCIV
jgi:uncharacterized ParB-like nuclease family protein